MANVLPFVPNDLQFESLFDNCSDDSSTNAPDSPVDFSHVPGLLTDLQFPPAEASLLDVELANVQVPDICLSSCDDGSVLELSELINSSVLPDSACLAALKALESDKTSYQQHTTVKKMKSSRVVEDERVVRRRTKNREAAQASRLRKRVKLETLEGLVAEQKAITAVIMSEREMMMRENAALRAEVDYLKQALRTSLDGLRVTDADQFFAHVAVGL